jgi:hypothetical protein
MDELNGQLFLSVVNHRHVVIGQKIDELPATEAGEPSCFA